MKTPRTDRAVLDCFQTGQHQKVKADFARQLEKEAKQWRTCASKLVEQLCSCSKKAGNSEAVDLYEKLKEELYAGN